MGVTVEEISVANGLNRMPACQSPGGMWNGDPQSGGTNLVKDACLGNCSEPPPGGGAGADLPVKGREWVEHPANLKAVAQTGKQE